MRIQVIINERAGSIVGAGGEAVAAQVTDALERAGHEVACRVAPPGKLADTVKSGLEAAPDAVLVGGGDGTARCAARFMIGTQIPLGILPIGTLNRLARDLDIPLDPASAALALSEGEVRAIDVAEVNGEIFLCNSVLGLPLHFSIERKKLRGRPFRERLSGYFTVIRKMLKSRRKLPVIVEAGGVQARVRALTVIVSSNGYAEEPSVMIRRRRLDGGELAVYVSRHSSGWAMARAAITAMLGRIEGAPNIIQLSGPSVTIDLGRTSATLSNDGEIETLSAPLQYTIRPQALRVLAPRQA